MKPRLVVIGPLPPPYHGVTVSTSLVIANMPLRDRFDVEHLDTSDHRSRDNIGRWEVRNVLFAVAGAGRLVRLLRGRRGVVYLPMSEGTPGFLRDSVLIHLAALARWRVAAHFRSGGFSSFYTSSHPLLRAWIRLSLGRLSAVAVLGESLRGPLEGLVPAERIAVVANGTPDVRLDGVKRDPETVLFLSNLRQRKGVVEAVEAAVTVVRRRPSARFVFAGSWESPDLERQLRDRAKEVGESVRFLSQVVGDQKLTLMQSASIFLFPPVEPEGHPRVVLEALAAGLPVVTTRRGAIADTVIDGECGYVLDDPHPDDLADRLLRLLEDQDLRVRLGHSARRRYLDGFTQEKADVVLTEWLDRIATSPSAP